MKWIDKSHMVEILIVLLDQPETYFTELCKKIDVQNFTKVNSRLEELKSLGFITDQYEKKFGRKRYIRLTDKGMDIAEQLMKIDEL